VHSPVHSENVDRATYRLAAATRSPVVPKEQLICDLCRHKRVLDIGCIDHSFETAIGLGDGWLHERLRRVATELVGLDTLEDDAKRLNEVGYDIRVGNAEDFDLDRTFDVIVGGDIVEHLSNPGSFLSAARRHMDDDSRLVLTTPNPFNVEQFFLALRHNKVSINPEHSAWFDPRVMYELVTRAGFGVERFRWIDTRFKMVDGWARHLADTIMRFRPITRRDFAVVLRRS
jgi:2-polyprenyl-3-methyl-5-hydroxy-6-metoxy-1,4-benzoquinol methylase